DGDDLDQAAWVPFLKSHERSSWPAGVNLSQVTIVPFYDRTDLIYETLGTLNSALVEEILVTMIVMLIMVLHLRSSLLISALLPVAVLMCFIAMRTFGVAANIVALSGIAIAIGTMVDMGVIICENILRHLKAADPDTPTVQTIFHATREVGSAVITSVATTVVSFLPVFTMTGAEGKLFQPLAFTKTFALVASIIVALTVIPPAAHILFTGSVRSARTKALMYCGLAASGLVLAFTTSIVGGVLLLAFAAYQLVKHRLPGWTGNSGPLVVSIVVALFVLIELTQSWLPLGPSRGFLRNLAFVGILIGGLLGSFVLFQRVYAPVLRWCLRNKLLFLSAPTLITVLGACSWFGFDGVFGFAPDFVRQSAPWQRMANVFPGLGKEFMPPLDEGSYLFMPTTLPHASIGESMDVLQHQDTAIARIPEVESVVGKLGRAETPLDPAPISMIETVINYRPEYITDKGGDRVNFRFDEAANEFERSDDGDLIVDPNGRPFRQWRDHIKSPDDIWDEIVAASEIPGTTSAPKLQPIAAPIVMLQSGMRAPMGIKVKGPDLATIEGVAVQLERYLKQVPGVSAPTVTADRLVGKPYLEIELDRKALGRYGLHIGAVQQVIEVAIGGKRITTTVEGRERYPVRVRYLRELRDTPESLGKILVPTPTGAQVPLSELSEIRFVRGPQAIKSEDTFLIGYVVFDKQADRAEVDVVEECQAFLQQKLDSGEFVLPAGVSYSFSGSYENQIRSQKTLALVLPVALFVIFLILYLQFGSVSTSLLVFSGIVVAWAGGFLLIWMYGVGGFLDIDLFGENMRELFQVHTINLSVAIWVGFLALFGIASDNGVVMATFLEQSFHGTSPRSREHVRDLVVEGARKRIRPALMTSATTILALIPVLTSTGRGSDIMVPMAIPSFGGMLIAMLTVFVVPVLYCAIKELRLGRQTARTG
ncbi:MAG: efflux RND transporter permease subunit, partial [Planctomycetes bacterium]|nr:efflux RND transporter permease subunit [Planctomycetota bacterium]